MYKLDFGVGEVIQNLAKERNDTELLIRISGYDLFACEAQKHPSCHRDYLLDNPDYWRSKDRDAKAKQTVSEEEHHKAFGVVCQVIEQSIITR